MTTFTVHTFYRAREGRRPVLSRITAYTVWADPSWDGCVTMQIEALAPADAKRIARWKRLEIEQRKAAGEME